MQRESESGLTPWPSGSIKVANGDRQTKSESEEAAAAAAAEEKHHPLQLDMFCTLVEHKFTCQTAVSSRTVLQLARSAPHKSSHGSLRPETFAVCKKVCAGLSKIGNNYSHLLPTHFGRHSIVQQRSHIINDVCFASIECIHSVIVKKSKNDDHAFCAILLCTILKN